MKEGVASGRGTAVPIDDGRVETKDGYRCATVRCRARYRGTQALSSGCTMTEIDVEISRSTAEVKTGYAAGPWSLCTLVVRSILRWTLFLGHMLVW